GRGVLIEGRLKFDTWQDQQGQTRSKHSIVADRVVFLGAGGGDAGEVQDEPGASDLLSNSSSRSAAPVSYGTQDTQEFSKVSQAIADKKRKKVSTDSTEFVDQPPFEDDLPF
ncbi:MAG: single-stranded DNA-binding protein, partial [Candidatus Dependentiae bacterium]|nr:single-stranded DNA-binding protein [Candidatus Dependentiae bacterium]